MPGQCTKQSTLLIFGPANNIQTWQNRSHDAWVISVEMFLKVTYVSDIQYLRATANAMGRTYGKHLA
jgi:hypothetical protein